uniref:Co-chaperonin GroES n=1 Tax=uncultured virus TaxID=340016 RepID=A0A221S2P2_9VIRU|nr:co-chaperonin GroES [uncultured virus]ASN63601.1 co-chaperonin GroES [uncultured virus]
MKAVNNYIIVENIKAEPTKVAGLILTETVDEDNRYIKANVVSTGNLVEGIKDKDVVYYDKHAGHGVQYNDKLYQVIQSRDVVLID